jgi:ribosomal protein S18 acetylase RimI-like enzyme
MSTDATADPSVEAVDLALRRAGPADVDDLAALATAARRAAVPAMPPPVHTPEEDREWIARQVAGERDAWVAESGGELVGYILLEPGWLHSLYVRPGRTGRGIGGVLLDLAKALQPAGLQLWVFETNVGAQRFYRRHGFVEVERTDGAGNEEKAPDIRMAWPG